MGFMDKLKALFKKEKGSSASAAPAKGKAAAPAKRADEFKGEGKVADALRYGANKIDTKVADGSLDEKKAALFLAQLKDCEASDADEDTKLVMIGQVIGAITFL